MVPAFVYLLNLEENEARATSIFCILPMVIVSGIFYNKANVMNLKLGTMCAIGGVIGGSVGSIFLKKIPTNILKISFTMFLFYMGIKMVF